MYEYMNEEATSTITSTNSFFEHARLVLLQVKLLKQHSKLHITSKFEASERQNTYTFFRWFELIQSGIMTKRLNLHFSSTISLSTYMNTMQTILKINNVYM